jgi:hypothetical protein
MWEDRMTTHHVGRQNGTPPPPPPPPPPHSGTSIHTIKTVSGEILRAAAGKEEAGDEAGCCGEMIRERSFATAVPSRFPCQHLNFGCTASTHRKCLESVRGHQLGGIIHAIHILTLVRRVYNLENHSVYTVPAVCGNKSNVTVRQKDLGT